MKMLLPIAGQIAERLIARKKTIAVVEYLHPRADRGGAAGRARRFGLFLGGAVVYTQTGARRAAGSYGRRHARPAAVDRSLCDGGCAARAQLMSATWGLGETGAAGPSGNRYGDAAGHTCIAVAGPLERATTLETGSAERPANMDAFARRALALLLEAISGAA